MTKKPMKPASEPPATETGAIPVMVRFTQEKLSAIDNWRRRQTDIPSRAEALRRLADAALDGEARAKPPSRRKE